MHDRKDSKHLGRDGHWLLFRFCDCPTADNII